MIKVTFTNESSSEFKGALWEKSMEKLVKNISKYSPEEIQLFNAIFEQGEDSSSLEEEFVLKLTGKRYSPSELKELEIRSLKRYFDRRRELLENSLTSSEVANLLGTSRQTPHDRLMSGTLLAIKDKGKYKFPLCQFDPEGPDGILEGIVEILKILPGSNFAKLNWIQTANPYMQGKTPIECLKEGDIKSVLTEAEIISSR